MEINTYFDHKLKGHISGFPCRYQKVLFWVTVVSVFCTSSGAIIIQTLGAQESECPRSREERKRQHIPSEDARVLRNRAVCIVVSMNMSIAPDDIQKNGDHGSQYAALWYLKKNRSKNVIEHFCPLEPC